jgi:hypothetical protein
VTGRALKVIGVGSMSKSKLLLISIRLILIVVAFGCFVEAYKFFDAGMPYVAETSSNPHPSEAAKMMGPKLMDSSRTFFFAGLACLATLIATLFIKAPTKSE